MGGVVKGWMGVWVMGRMGERVDEWMGLRGRRKKEGGSRDEEGGMIGVWEDGWMGRGGSRE